MRKTPPSRPDTNVIVRYLMADNPRLYAKARKFFESVRVNEATAIVSESVIAECVYVLTKIYKAPRERAAQSLMDILRYRGIANSDREELIDALTLYADRSVDIVDCILLAKAKARGEQVITFDEKLSKLARRV